MAWQSRTLISWLRAQRPDTGMAASGGSTLSQGAERTS